MNNLISIVNNFNLVIYTDENSSKFIFTNNNSKIKIITKSIEEFYNYKYKDLWIKNHSTNFLLNNKSSWELNMLWSEKIWFVKETIERKYFDTDFYGWCDIGYFRNRNSEYIDLDTSFLSNWPNNNKINNLDKNKIIYACINNNDNYINNIYKLINKKNNIGLPINPIPPNQESIAGGFFILHKNMIYWWSKIYDDKLNLYLTNDYLVKDDQIILVDCILSNTEYFSLFRENKKPYDNWFMFQRILN
jgi:hypothetical protein